MLWAGRQAQLQNGKTQKMRTLLSKKTTNASHKNENKINCPQYESTMGKHRNPYISDEASDERCARKSKIAKPSLDVEEPKSQNKEETDGGTFGGGNKTLDGKCGPALVSPEKQSILSDVQPPRNIEIQKTYLQKENTAIEALMVDPIHVSGAAGISKSIMNHIDKTAAEVYGENLKGGLTIVYVNYSNSDESAYVMQAVTAISRNIGSLPSLGVIHIATRAQAPCTNKAKINMDLYKQHIFVMVNKHCPKLRETNGLSSVLGTFATWLNTHMFSKKKGLVAEKSFCNYALARDFDRTNQTSPRKLADIILLTEAIAIVQDLFPTDVDKNTFETRIIPAYFSQPYPQEMYEAFHLIRNQQE